MTDHFFLGLPVTGQEPHEDIRYSRQRPLAELEPLFRAVLDDDGVSEFGWTQADPDDDPLDEYVSELWFRAAGDTEGHPLDDHPTIEAGDRYDRCAALAEALEYGFYDDVLREHLGDWCDVRVTRSVITVSEPNDDEPDDD
ncbi:MAG: hypothetical protein ACRDT6_19210 [Micromonosporaceae bacterium]